MTEKNYMIKHRAVQRMSQLILKSHNIFVFGSLVKQNRPNDSNETCRYVHDFSLHQTSFV
jgi:hypothetical protein